MLLHRVVTLLSESVLYTSLRFPALCLPPLGPQVARGSYASTSSAPEQAHSPEQQQEHHGSGSAGDSTAAVVRSVLRESHAAQVASSAFFRGQASTAALRGPRPDLRHMQEAELGGAQAVAEMLPKYRSRPSLLLGPLRAASFALGA